MSKKVKFINKPLSCGGTVNMEIHDLSPKSAKKMINRIWNRHNNVLMVRSRSSLALPNVGVEIHRISQRCMSIARVTSPIYQEPSLEQLVEWGYTDYYNGFINQWVSLQEAIDKLAKSKPFVDVYGKGEDNA